MGKNILMIVDMQNDFITGALSNDAAQKIVPKIVERIKEHDGPIIVTYDTHTDEYMETQEGKRLPVKHCVYGTHGHNINCDISEALEGRHAITIMKPTFGFLSFDEVFDTYDIVAEDIDNIDICGTCTDICVVSNALVLKATFPDANIRILADLCAAVDEEGQRAALKVLERCQCDIISLTPQRGKK